MLNGVAEAVGVIIGWVDTPLVPGVGVGGVLDPVGHRVLLAVLHGQFHAEGDLEEGNHT